VTSFDAKTGKDVHDAIERLGGAKLKGLVLDLRGNPGGLLPPALETAAMFLKPGQRLLSVRGRKSQTENVDVPKEAGAPYGFPVAVLINEKSASGSEIVAGALQDHDRATILGSPSYGKGLVQSVYPLSANTGLALTTAFYYTPSGRSIQRPLAGVELSEAVAQTRRDQGGEFQTDSGRKVRGGGGIQPDILVQLPAQTRLTIAIEASASLANFATVIARRGGVTPAFEVTGALLDEFKVWLSERRIQPGIAEWSRDREWIRYRLKQEIFNQALGVAKGDEVEAANDPVVQEALRALGV
jgi:carboxyl-terminal processing protease